MAKMSSKDAARISKNGSDSDFAERAKDAAAKNSK